MIFNGLNRFRGLVVLTSCVSLAFPLTGEAQTSTLAAIRQEAERRMSEWTGGVETYVLLTDCAAEQDDYSRSHSSGPPLREVLARPWTYRFDGPPTGALQTPTQMRDTARVHDEEGAKTRRNYPRDLQSISQSALTACAYRAAAARVETRRANGGTRAPSPAPAAEIKPDTVTCAAKEIRALNTELADQDARLQRFLDTSQTAKVGNSAAGERLQPVGMLTVTLWALNSRINAIKRTCPQADAYKEHLAALEQSLSTTLAACEQVRASTARCVAAPPESLP